MRTMISGHDFTVTQYIGIIWTRQGTKKITEDDHTIIELEETASGKVLMTRSLSEATRTQPMDG